MYKQQLYNILAICGLECSQLGVICIVNKQVVEIDNSIVETPVQLPYFEFLL